jgi:putative N-acetylmannosamine-6-phosphate epimerase
MVIDTVEQTLNGYLDEEAARLCPDFDSCRAFSANDQKPDPIESTTYS